MHLTFVTLMSIGRFPPHGNASQQTNATVFFVAKYDQIDRAETHGAQLILFPTNVNEVTEMRQDKCSMPLNMFTETFTSGNMVSTWLKLNIKSYIRT